MENHTVLFWMLRFTHCDKRLLHGGARGVTPITDDADPLAPKLALVSYNASVILDLCDRGRSKA
jgi:hypothetical protein